MKKTLQVGGQNGLEVSAIALGCMHLAELDIGQADALVRTALDCGVTYFDHADIYGGGGSEELFGRLLEKDPALRGKMRVQSKCGICPGYFDFSKEHILDAVDNSLRRLHTDYLDALLLHRPDTLMEPEEVAEAFDRLEAQGKVLHFGVSNQNPGQMELLRRAVRQPLLFNQLQFGPMHTGMIDSGLNVNMTNPPSVDHDGGLLEYCRLNGVTIQPWSPYQYGFFEGVYLDNPQFPALNQALGELAAQKGISAQALVIAWILRHPAGMQPIVGTTKPERLKDIAAAYDVELTRPEWYAIYRAAGNVLP